MRTTQSSSLYPTARTLPAKRQMLAKFKGWNATTPSIHTRVPRFSAIIAHAGDLASFNRLPSHSSTTIGHSVAAPWFSRAITEVVKHLDSAPFLQLVRFADAPLSPRASSQSPHHHHHNNKFSSFSVPDSVVSAPELWASIAEATTAESADVVILVQRVDTTEAHSTSSMQDNLPHKNSEIKSHVEEACRKLVASGVGEDILQGKVGECCDDHRRTKTSSNMPTKIPSSGIVPFHSGGSGVSVLAQAKRKAVKVKALPAGGNPSPTPLSGYWGVVVQSKHHTGAEGCYLLRAVRQVGAPHTHAALEEEEHGCSCTHYSLTRVCQGEHMERQFVNSWLV